MNLAELVKVAEKRLKRIEPRLTFDLLAGDERKADKRRYRSFSKVPVADYVEPGDDVEFHRSLMPEDQHWYGDAAPAQVFYWNDWTLLPIDSIGPDCVRVLMPGRGSHPIPVGDFVRAVVRGHIREPTSDS